MFFHSFPIKNAFYGNCLEHSRPVFFGIKTLSRFMTRTVPEIRQSLAGQDDKSTPGGAAAGAEPLQVAAARLPRSRALACAAAACPVLLLWGSTGSVRTRPDALALTL